MPTATTTLTSTVVPSPISIKPGSSPVPPFRSADTNGSSLSASVATAATLRSLYTRAARAFLLRDVVLTHSLLESAFGLIHPPVSYPDALADHRRKWDILRITLESTVYAAPPASRDNLPQSLSSLLTESSQALMTRTHNRSLALFTPTSGHLQKTISNAAFLPSQVLMTLVYSSLKIDCPDVGRVIIEDWLARRDPSPSEFSTATSVDQDADAYEKVLELYCLHILPKLDQWDYAKDFLDYEGELPAHCKEQLQSNLKSLYAQALASRRFQDAPTPPPSNPTQPPHSPRSYSPAPSSSSSSSLSTTSTHTVTPSTFHGKRSVYQSSGLSSIAQVASGSSESLSSDSTATPHVQATSRPNGNRSRSHARTANSSTTSDSHISAYSRTRVVPIASAVRPASPSAFALIKASLQPYLTTPKMSTLFLLFLVLPLLSFALRMRNRRRRQLLGRTHMASNVDLVRSRLSAVAGMESGLIIRLWREIIRAVVDTVRMAGSGLV